MGDDKTMSQAEIDAMLGASLGEIAEPGPRPAEAAATAAATKMEPKAAPPAETVQAAKAKPAPPASTAQKAPQPPAPSTGSESMQSAVADLAQRITKIETAMGRLDQLQKTVTEANAILRKQPRDFQSVVNQLQELSDEVEEISQNLRSTPVYDMRQIFRCNVCDSHGLCAIRVKCTECGRENWWGWWPEK